MNESIMDHGYEFLCMNRGMNKREEMWINLNQYEPTYVIEHGHKGK